MEGLSLYGVYWLSSYSHLIPLFVYCFLIKESPRQNHLVATVVLVSFAADLITFFQLTPAPIVFNFQDGVQFALLSVLYFEMIFKKRFRYVLYGEIMVYILMAFFAVSNSGLFEYHNFLWTTSGLIISCNTFIYTNTYLFRNLENILDVHLYNRLILNASLSFYFTGTLIIFLATDYIFSEYPAEVSELSWSFHNVINILKNIGIAVGFYYTGKRKIDLTTEQLEVLERLSTKKG